MGAQRWGWQHGDTKRAPAALLPASCSPRCWRGPPGTGGAPPLSPSLPAAQPPAPGSLAGTLPRARRHGAGRDQILRSCTPANQTGTNAAECPSQSLPLLAHTRSRSRRRGSPGTTGTPSLALESQRSPRPSSRPLLAAGGLLGAPLLALALVPSLLLLQPHAGVHAALLQQLLVPAGTTGGAAGSRASPRAGVPVGRQHHAPPRLPRSPPALCNPPVLEHQDLVCAHHGGEPAGG